MYEHQIMTIAFNSDTKLCGKTRELLICSEEDKTKIYHEYKGAKIARGASDVKDICPFTLESLMDCDIRNKRGTRQICPFSLETCI